MTTCPAMGKMHCYISRNARHPLHVWTLITVLHKCNSSCVCSDVDFSRVPICLSGRRSSDDPLKSQQGQNVSVHECDDSPRAGAACRVKRESPADSLSAKRLLSSVLPSIFMHDSMTLATVVSLGVLRWTMRSEAATQERRRSQHVARCSDFQQRSIQQEANGPLMVISMSCEFLCDV